MALQGIETGIPAPRAPWATTFSPEFLEQIGAEMLVMPKRTPVVEDESELQASWSLVEARLTGTSIRPETYGEIIPHDPRVNLNADHVEAIVNHSGEMHILQPAEQTGYDG